MLYYRQEKSIDEVASCLEISNETARQRLARGRDMLREKVACLIEDVCENNTHRKFTRTVMATIAGIASLLARRLPHQPLRFLPQRFLPL